MCDDTRISWRGKFLEDTTKEELIDAVKFMGKELQRLHSPCNIEARALGRVEQFKRSLTEAS